MCFHIPLLKEEDVCALPRNMKLKHTPGDLFLAHHKYKSQSPSNLQILLLPMSHFQISLSRCQQSVHNLPYKLTNNSPFCYSDASTSL